MNQKQKNWLSYWKNSLADSQRMNIDFEKQLYFRNSTVNLSEGALAVEEVIQLIEKEEEKKNKSKGINNKDSEEWEVLNEVPLIIAPFVLNLKPEYLQELKGDKVVRPFWIMANVNRQGELSPHESFFPVIPRSVLSPLTSEEQDFFFSSVDDVDLAASIRKEGFNSWNEYWEFVLIVFKQLKNQDINQYQEELYTVIPEVLFFVPDEKIGAAASIIQLYEKLINTRGIPPLLRRIINTESPFDNKPLRVSKYISTNVQHLGQMGDDFPLSITQRKTLYTFFETEDSEVFAVNGPPGTGKTTLLQSVVANSLVQSAIKGIEAPIVLACSTNNQAVTNINESFSKTNSRLDKLAGRWLPDFNGYATYLPSKSKKSEDLKGINYLKQDGESTFQKMEKLEYLDQAKSYYLKKSSEFSGEEFHNITVACEFIRNEIIQIKQEVSKSSSLWKSYKRQERKIIKSFTNCERKLILEKDRLEGWISELSLLEENTIAYFRSESLLRKLFCFFRLKYSIKNRISEVKRVFRDASLKLEHLDYSSQTNILQFLDEKILLLKDTISALRKWNNWKVKNNIKGNPPNLESELWEYEALKAKKKNLGPCYFYDELDVTLRHKAFQLAIHYWEGRWLEATKEMLDNDTEKGKGRSAIEAKWKRRAMLTPCFVSTFYMAPKFFTYYKFLGKSGNGLNLWDIPPLANFIDILIVDESGQVSPEIGVASFALAKKAVVVGDVKQIEPVWNVTSKVDIGNLEKNNLYNNDELESIVDAGFLASCGSIMKMAQNACSYCENEKVGERGLFLTEHRRCNDEIINYCNELAYNGLLKPMKGKAKSDQLFPSMMGVHVEGSSYVRNKDRYNEIEVKIITEWLLENKALIESKYSDSNKKLQIEDLVGIVTPFKGQKIELQRSLQKAGFKTYAMKLGTVHALQGAERPIILFSSVYGPDDTGTMFFDRDNKPNMLNVAVSRAKDSFIVFGNKKIFNEKVNTPSGILSRHIKIWN